MRRGRVAGDEVVQVLAQVVDAGLVDLAHAVDGGIGIVEGFTGDEQRFDHGFIVDETRDAGASGDARTRRRALPTLAG